jgi:hypothetical protein
MWITTYHRFTNRAAFLAACEAAGWAVQHHEPLLPHGVALDSVGPLIGPPSVGDGGAPIPGEVIDPRWHVNLAWHAQEVPAAFAESQVAPEAPARRFDVATPAPAAPPVPHSIPAWKARAALREAGLLATVAAAVDAAGGRVADAWAGAAEWHRDSAFLSDLSAALGLSPAEVDQMFRDADAIRS